MLAPSHDHPSTAAACSKLNEAAQSSLFEEAASRQGTATRRARHPRSPAAMEAAHHDDPANKMEPTPAKAEKKKAPPSLAVPLPGPLPIDLKAIESRRACSFCMENP